jgi:hypothetical protein
LDTLELTSQVDKAVCQNGMIQEAFLNPKYLPCPNIKTSNNLALSVCISGSLRNKISFFLCANASGFYQEIQLFISQI